MLTRYRHPKLRLSVSQAPSSRPWRTSRLFPTTSFPLSSPRLRLLICPQQLQLLQLLTLPLQLPLLHTLKCHWLSETGCGHQLIRKVSWVKNGIVLSHQTKFYLMKSLYLDLKRSASIYYIIGNYSMTM